MEEWRRRRRPRTRGAILATCPVCKGAGKVPKELPFLANPRAPQTRADKLGMRPCPRCNGSGRIGAE